jgi:hypothetical protein
VTPCACTCTIPFRVASSAYVCSVSAVVPRCLLLYLASHAHSKSIIALPRHLVVSASPPSVLLGLVLLSELISGYFYAALIDRCIDDSWRTLCTNRVWYSNGHLQPAKGLDTGAMVPKDNERAATSKEGTVIGASGRAVGEIKVDLSSGGGKGWHSWWRASLKG